MIQEFDLNKNKCHAALSHLLGCSYDTFFVLLTQFTSSLEILFIYSLGIKKIVECDKIRI